MLQGKTFDHRPISELLSIVRNDLKKFDAEGLIDEGVLIKTILQCNERMGIYIRDVKQCALPVNEFKALLPLDFEKIYFACALKVSNTIMHEVRNPFDNNFDQDIVWEAEVDRQTLGNTPHYNITIKRETGTVIYQDNSLVQLDIQNGAEHCHIDCPNRRRKGRYSISIKDDHIETPFRAGILYLMYIGSMKNENGEITFPFHPMITPYYEWSVKEKIISDAIFNTDASKQMGELYQLAQRERAKAWLDAYAFTTDRNYGEYVKLQRRKELQWYNQYFKLFQ